MNLIDKDALIQELDITDMDCDKCLWRDKHGCSRGSAFVRVCSAIENAKIIKEHKTTGKWVRRKDSDCWECSNCRAVLEIDDLGMHNFYYCYHCGTKMESVEV